MCIACILLSKVSTAEQPGKCIYFGRAFRQGTSAVRVQIKTYSYCLRSKFTSLSLCRNGALSHPKQ